jgi:hypothetical protein
VGTGRWRSGTVKSGSCTLAPIATDYFLMSPSGATQPAQVRCCTDRLFGWLFSSVNLIQPHQIDSSAGVLELVARLCQRHSGCRIADFAWLWPCGTHSSCPAAHKRLAGYISVALPHCYKMISLFWFDWYRAWKPAHGTRLRSRCSISTLRPLHSSIRSTCITTR